MQDRNHNNKIYDTELTIEDLINQITKDQRGNFPWTKSMQAARYQLAPYVYPVLHGSGFPIKPECIPNIIEIQGNNHRVSGFIIDPATGAKLKVITYTSWKEKIAWQDEMGNPLSVEQRKSYPFQNNGQDPAAIIIDDTTFQRRHHRKPKKTKTNENSSAVAINLNSLTVDLPILNLVEQATSLPAYRSAISHWLGLKSQKRGELSESRYPVLYGSGLPLNPIFIPAIIEPTGADHYRMGTIKYSVSNTDTQTIVVVSNHKWCKDLALVDQDNNELPLKQRKLIDFANDGKDVNFLTHNGITYYRKRERHNHKRRMEREQRLENNTVTVTQVLPCSTQQSSVLPLNTYTDPVYTHDNTVHTMAIPEPYTENITLADFYVVDPNSTLNTSTTSLQNHSEINEINLNDFYLPPAMPSTPSADMAFFAHQYTELSDTHEVPVYTANPLFDSNDVWSNQYLNNNNITEDQVIAAPSNELQQFENLVTMHNNGLLHNTWATVFGLSNPTTLRSQPQTPIPHQNTPSHFFYHPAANRQNSTNAIVDLSGEGPAEFTTQDHSFNKRRKL